VGCASPGHPLAPLPAPRHRCSGRAVPPDFRPLPPTVSIEPQQAEHSCSCLLPAACLTPTNHAHVRLATGRSYGQAAHHRLQAARALLHLLVSLPAPQAGLCCCWWMALCMPGTLPPPCCRHVQRHGIPPQPLHPLLPAHRPGPGHALQPALPVYLLVGCVLKGCWRARLLLEQPRMGPVNDAEVPSSRACPLCCGAIYMPPQPTYALM